MMARRQLTGSGTWTWTIKDTHTQTQSRRKIAVSTCIRLSKSDIPAAMSEARNNATICW